jgi:hypothetical protein
MSSELWNWSPHPKNKNIRVRYAAKGVVAFEFKHPQGIQTISFGSKMADWILEVPHCPGGTSWYLNDIDVHRSGEGHTLVTLTFNRIWSLRDERAV